MNGVELYDRARERIAAHGFDADIQTRIALFVGTTKGLNAALLGPSEWAPARTAAYPFMHGQYFRECEFAVLLARVTHWTSNPLIYFEAAALVEPLWREWLGMQSPLGTLPNGQVSYRALAFGHALLARVRLAPVIPANADEADPFVLALRRIEQENGRMIQAQIRLLKESPIDLPPAERARIVEDEQLVVDAAFARFLSRLAEEAHHSPPLPDFPSFWSPFMGPWRSS